MHGVASSGELDPGLLLDTLQGADRDVLAGVLDRHDSGLGRCAPFVRAWTQPSALMSLITSVDDMAKYYNG
jgi:hypothetical protein